MPDACAAARALLVLDLEATCDEDVPPPAPREILQIAVVVHAPFGPFASVHGERFEQLVRPADPAGITPFCQRLTGITPERALRDGVPFRVAHARLLGWLVGLGLLIPLDRGRTGRRLPPVLFPCGGWLFATYGSCDLAEMWPEQCALSGIPVAPWFRRWVDVAREFVAARGGGARLVSLRQASFALLGSTDDARAHDALADAEACAAVLAALQANGHWALSTVGAP